MTSVVIVGIDPPLIDFSLPAYAAFPGLTAAKIMAGLEHDKAKLEQLGYRTEILAVDFGETAEAVLRERLRREPVDCVLFGGGLRLIPPNTALFEKLINIAHTEAPQAKFCFNTGPTDSAEVVQRWVTP